jgi:hypothetical protein
VNAEGRFERIGTASRFLTKDGCPTPQDFLLGWVEPTNLPAASREGSRTRGRGWNSVREIRPLVLREGARGRAPEDSRTLGFG